MDFDQLLIRFFGTEDVGDLPSDRLAAGIDQLLVEIGLEQDDGRRFGLWCLAYMLGCAPALDAVFEDEADKDAARDFMDSVDRQSEEDD
ncbi:hypothetical protein GGR88_000180 [Sphingomonas jejuensis]|uniref:Uncharacterized protein n=1 Tax=Sphingomonas jejuensis TaxID=904715 RepID=A0ABX0XIY5_9SPHN|nr:hypothetical protein [Sphingomonas jejuensis]NJC32706.1 hypothetical protein [Sphingomonas jejuensis]